MAARGTDYMESLSSAWDGDGPCTAIGQVRSLDAAGAALLNGAGIHGEDFDDSFEGSPLHAGAAAIPGVLAVCERYGLTGEDFLRGLTGALETMCRLTLVAPGGVHRSGFQPASVFGCVGATVGVGVALRLSPTQMVNALGIAGSMAGGLMEFLSEGAWTKRLHPGWAAQSGIRAALMGRQGFIGPRTVFEGPNGFFKAFSSSVEADFTQLTAELGSVWRSEGIIFKLYPCGTPIGPYIDCAIRLAERGVKAEEIVSITCAVAEPVICRQWAPIEEKRRPPTAFAAKFSGPFGVALGFLKRAAGLREYTEDAVHDPAVLSFMQKIGYETDLANEYPRNYTGHLRAVLRDGSVHEIRQPHLRGGSREPFSEADLVRKFRDNVAFGGWPPEAADRLHSFCTRAFSVSDFSELKSFRETDNCHLTPPESKGESPAPGTGNLGTI